MVRAKLELDLLKQKEIVALANKIMACMTGNATFGAPNPSLPALGALISAAEAKLGGYAAALTALQVARLERDDAIRALCLGLTQEASYVENVSAGDPAKIQSAGMGLRGRGSKVGPMPRVQDLVVAEGDKDGTLDTSWNPVYGARCYEIQIALHPDDDAGWTFSMTAGKSSATLTGLTSGARLWVRVRAIGAKNNKGAWSDPAVKTVP